jgi:hypothetical protein
MLASLLLKPASLTFYNPPHDDLSSHPFGTCCCNIGLSRNLNIFCCSNAIPKTQAKFHDGKYRSQIFLTS